MPEFDICGAIQSRSVVSVRYGSRDRIVEPYIHGLTSEGIEVVLCYQREGDSASGFRTSWRTFHVDRIEAFEILPVKFVFDRADFEASAREVRNVHCTVAPPE